MVRQKQDWLIGGEKKKEETNAMIINVTSIILQFKSVAHQGSIKNAPK